MIIRHLNALRSRSVEVRRRAAMIYSIVFTSCIVIIWLTTLFAGRANTADTSAQSGGNAIPTTGELFRATNQFLNENILSSKDAFDTTNGAQNNAQ